MIPRTSEKYLRDAFSRYPVVTLTGPRQSGKSTLCRSTFPQLPYSNLESPDIREFAERDPRGFLAQFPAGAIFDEIQRVPNLLSYLQPLVDESARSGQFIITGSQQFEVIEGVSQSLAGRTAILKLLPFSIEELKQEDQSATTDDLIFSGFYPPIYDRELPASEFLSNYFDTYVQRDVTLIENIRNRAKFERFVRLCAGRAGQLSNLTNLGSEAGVSHTTAQHWITVLEASFIVFRLPPYFANISKRLIKSPKLYFYDTGLLCYLLGIQNPLQISSHPLRGPLFENLVISEVIKYFLHRGRRPQLFFYRENSKPQVEVDLLIETGSTLLPIEIKASHTLHSSHVDSMPKMEKSLGITVPHRALVHDGDKAGSRFMGATTTTPGMLADDLHLLLDGA